MKSNIQPYNSFYSKIKRILDFIFPIITLYVVTIVSGRATWRIESAFLAFISGLLFVIFSSLNGAYGEWRGKTPYSDATLYSRAWVSTWLTLIGLAFAFKVSESFSRVVIFSWGGSTFIGLLFYNIALKWSLGKFLSNKNNMKKVVLVGAGTLGQRLAEIFNAKPWLGCEIVAFYDDNMSLIGKKVKGINVEGDCVKLLADAYENNFSTIYICLPLRVDNKISQLIEDLSNTSCQVNFAPDLFSFDLIHSKWIDLGGFPVISVYDSPLDSFGSVIKRTEDIVLAAIIILITFPIMMAIAIAIKLTSKGPVLFKQKRYGVNGKEINVWKFRSMTTCENGTVIRQAQKKDKRITKIGSFLRKTSLDELPQFFNVLYGTMSVVGPRPHATAHNEHYRKLIPGYMQRHLIKPGITGWAQVNGWRGETDTLDKMENRIKYDMDYIRRWSFWLDLKIVILTIFKGFVNKNAY